MRIVLLIGSGNNHKALANKIAKANNVVGIIVENKKTKTKSNLSSLLSKIIDRTLFFTISSVWLKLMKYYAKTYSEYPSSFILFVNNINENENINIINKLKADLIVVSGTRIIKKNILSTINSTKGICNLHTGISPYIKGGPNCTNWCIAENKRELIGNTIMWIAEGIDNGNIITTEKTDIKLSDSYFEIQLKVMEHAHLLYLRVIEKIKNDEEIPNIDQNTIVKGVLYTNKMWDFSAKKRLLFNLKKIKKNNEFFIEPILIPLT